MRAEPLLDHKEIETELPEGLEEPVVSYRAWSQRLAGPGIAATIFLLSRVVVLVTATAVTWVSPSHTVTQLLAAWDGGWYLKIAEFGYPDHLHNEFGPIGNRWAFYPGLPMLTRAVSRTLGLSLPVSGVLVATVCGGVAAVGIWLLVEERLGRDAAIISTALVCFFPSAYVLSMVYAEPLFLALSAFCLRAIGRRQWLLAGILASVSCLVRNTGLVLVATVGVAVLVEVLRRRTWRPVVGMVVAPVGFLVWSGYQWAQVGTPTATFDAQDLWYQRFVWFTTPLKSLGRVLTQPSAWSDAQDVMAASAVVFIAVSLVLAVFWVHRRTVRVPVEWWVYTAGVVLLAFSPYWPSSVLRYSLLAYPLYAVAWHRTPRWLVVAGIGASGAIMAALGFAAFYGAISWPASPFAP
jgi:hypothetical protein